MKTDSRVRLIQSTNQGLVSALNQGVSEATNRWIARFDVDDTYEKERLEVQRTYIDKLVVGIFTDYDFYSECGQYLGVMPTAIDSRAVTISLISSTRTPHPSVLFDKEAVLEVGGYREIDFPAEDLSLWLRLSREGKLISIPKVLLHYRLSVNSITGQKRNEAIKKKNQLLREIGIAPTSINEFTEGLPEIQRTYAENSYEQERTILLIRDLVLLSKYNSIKRTQKSEIVLNILKLSFKSLHSHQSIKATAKLFQEQNMRKKIRKNHTNTNETSA
jgi:glycosyltransferase involved in cell wall biosynthesis